LGSLSDGQSLHLILIDERWLAPFQPGLPLCLPLVIFSHLLLSLYVFRVNDLERRQLFPLTEVAFFNSDLSLELADSFERSEWHWWRLDHQLGRLV
jgi:hypothetical protein